ncbi:MAG: GvpL/GvpF family gas vesicle protein [Azospirillaceae bacterium]|nr:GvpL/GvpF family gas vesicle protein [Azospirillaceae bacterium]
MRDVASLSCCAPAPVLESGEAVCLFAFALSAEPHHGPSGGGDPGGDDLAGGDPAGRGLLLHRIGSVTALVGIVSLADYCGAGAERRLADLAWLAPRARRHAEIVAQTMQWSPVFPAPFGTLYKSFDNLTAFIQRHHATIVGFLRTVVDKEEWELRADGQFDSPETLDQLACAARPEWRDLPKGVRYMRLCRDRSALLDFGRVEATALVSDLIKELQPLTDAFRQHDNGQRMESSATESIARYALLVAKTNAATLCESVREVALVASRRHVAITLSGPWAPFSFRPDLNAPT